MKKFLFMFAAVATLFTACNNEADDNNVKHDHSVDIVGTWTCLTENYAEALIINADGTAVSYGVENGEYWENVRGTVTTNGNDITMTFEDDDNLTGHFDIIPGMAFSLFEDSGERYVYQYCKEDLSEEIIGMWVCNEGISLEKNGMAIHTYTESGETYLTTPTSAGTGDYAKNEESEYKVVGNLMFMKLMHLTLDSGVYAYAATRLTYTPNATSAGDIMTFQNYMPTTDGFVEEVSSFLRIKQSLDLANNSYDYNNIYVTNVRLRTRSLSLLVRH